MKKILVLFCLLIGLSKTAAQTHAITDEGKEVILLDNGTWKYSQDSTDVAPVKVDSLAMNKAKFNRLTSASFLVKSKVFNIGVYMNPAKWTLATKRDNEKTPEYRFGLKSDDGYVMMVSEATPIDLENMRDIALMNAQKVSVDVKETAAEYRIVNGLKILCLQFKGTIKGIKFVYYGYYYSNVNGTVQLIGYTSQQKFNSLKKELENFLNGLVEIK